MGFNPRLAPYSVSEVFSHDPGGDEAFSIMRFPAVGRVLGAYATNTTTQIAGAGTNLAMFLVKLSAAATPVVQGTLGSWSTGPWGEDIPRTMTMTSYRSTAIFSAGEWVRLSYDETATGTWTELGFQMDYIIGSDIGAPLPSAATGPA